MEGGLDRIAQARGAMERKDIPKKGTLITKAIGIVGGLRDGLDTQKSADVLGNLDSLYVYMMRRLVEANAKNDLKILDEVSGLLGTLKDGWDAIAAK
jgi:flagellar protein FliS